MYGEAVLPVFSNGFLVCGCVENDVPELLAFSWGGVFASGWREGDVGILVTMWLPI